MNKRRLMVGVLGLLLSGCAGFYVPPCDDTMALPCYGLSNGTRSGPLNSRGELMKDGKPLYPALIIIDAKERVQHMRMGAR